jgi:signal transduction histidine kinase
VPWAIGLQVTDLARPSGFWLYAIATGFAYTLFWSGALHLALVFPTTHRFASGRGRLLAIAYGLPIGGQLALTIGAGLVSGSALVALDAWIAGQAVLQVGVLVGSLGSFGYSYVRIVDPVARAQVKWMAAALVVAGTSGLLLWFGPVLITGSPLVPPSAVALLALPFPVALGIAIDRHHLFDLDRVLNRSLVYGGLTAGVILTYAATVAAIGGLIPGNAPFAVALLGAGAVAVVALPLHERLQGSVNRMMYGDRDEPDNALRRLGRRLEASVDPQTVLPTLVETVAEALRAPYVAIEFERDGAGRIEAAHGAPPSDPSGPRQNIRVPIRYRGADVGTLLVSARAPDEPFGPADEALLADLARQAAPTVEALRLTADLRRSREALVATREEERRRLRRDLHDELGPALAAAIMKAGAARHLLASDPDRASSLLDGLETDARAMVEDIRRMARDLRPPALDELGLLGVLRERVAGFDDPVASERPVRVSLDAPDVLPAFPAAVEVAALRIALEGLTNAARHSDAAAIQVGLRVDGETLVVWVRDDGEGIAADAPPGVGLISMRERADELGGTLSVDTPDGGGTLLTARLPFASEPSA